MKHKFNQRGNILNTCQKTLDMDIQSIKQAVREVLREELPSILKEVMLDTIPFDEPEEDERAFVDEKINEKDYVRLKEI